MRVGIGDKVRGVGGVGVGRGVGKLSQSKGLVRLGLEVLVGVALRMSVGVVSVVTLTSASPLELSG